MHEAGEAHCNDILRARGQASMIIFRKAKPTSARPRPRPKVIPAASRRFTNKAHKGADGHSPASLPGDDGADSGPTIRRSLSTVPRGPGVVPICPCLKSRNVRVRRRHKTYDAMMCLQYARDAVAYAPSYSSAIRSWRRASSTTS